MAQLAHISGDEIDVLASWMGADFDYLEDCCVAAYLVPLHELDINCEATCGYALFAKEVRAGYGRHAN